MPDIARFLILFAAAYIIGSVPMAYLVVKIRYKADIRNFGSGQVGGSNVFRSFSRPLGVIVGLYDLGKGILMVWIARAIGLDIAFQAAVGLAVIVGHNWPVFLRFNAGRGLAATAGIGLFVLPLSFPGFLVCAIFTLFEGSSPLPLLAAVASLPVTSLILHFTDPSTYPLALTWVMIAIFCVMVVRRLTAPRTSAVKTSKKKLFFNRLLYDRDIQDGDTWIYRKPVAPEAARKEKNQV